MGGVAARYEEVLRRVANAAARAGRDPSDITIVAVSKTFGAEPILEALDAGIENLGENRAQELREKAGILGARARWHFIGPLQTNKVRHVVGTASLIHSVDRIGLAEEIARRARAAGVLQPVLVEVNVAGEDTKHGVLPDRTPRLTAEVAALEGIEVRGLMTMPPYPEAPEDSRPHYRALRALRDGLSRDMPAIEHLSMGLTRDFEVAVEEGATLLRIGEAIFGPRRSL